MEQNEFISTLTQAFDKNGLGKMLTKERSAAFFALTERMLSENQKYNLTAITDTDLIILNHYVDCAHLAARIPHGASVIDIGCGAGFPSLVIAILRPDVTVMAADSTAKRINYVGETAAMLGLGNVTAVVMRAEDGGRVEKYREKFDIATARAVANMRILAELCLPFVKIGGQMMAMKGKNAEFELGEAKKAIATLGGRNARTEKIILHGFDSEEPSHPLILIDKCERTPAAYPRQYSQISKKPL